MSLALMALSSLHCTHCTHTHPRTHAGAHCSVALRTDGLGALEDVPLLYIAGASMIFGPLYGLQNVFVGAMQPPQQAIAACQH